MIQLRQKRGYSVATFDLEIHPAMNFLTPAGFLSLASILVIVPLKWTYLMDLNGPSGVHIPSGSLQANTLGATTGKP